jgi:hypothetical protein
VVERAKHRGVSLFLGVESLHGVYKPRREWRMHQRTQRRAEHFLLKKGDLLIKVERVELIVPQSGRRWEQSVRGGVKERREGFANERTVEIDRDGGRGGERGPVRHREWL